MPESVHSAAQHGSLVPLLAVWAAVALAPVLVSASRRPNVGARVLAASIPGAVLAIVALHLLPSSLQTSGFWAAAALVLGFAAPTLTDQLLRGDSSESGSAVASMVFVLAALTPHFLLDGLALVSHGHAHGHGDGGHLARVLAVSLHTLPLSAMLWLTGLRSGHRALGVAALIYTAAATAAGLAVGELVFTHLTAHHTALFDAFVGGTLIHVASHAHGTEGGERRRSVGAPELVGLGAAVVLTLMLPHADEHDHGAPLALNVWSVGLVLALTGANLWLVSRRRCQPVVPEASA